MSPAKVEVARQLLGYLGETGYQPSSFETKLLAVMFAADWHNLARLGIVFPTYAWAVDVYKNLDGGLDTLREIAK